MVASERIMIMAKVMSWITLTKRSDQLGAAYI